MERERQQDVLMTVQTEIPGQLVLGKALRAFRFDFIDFLSSFLLQMLWKRFKWNVIIGTYK